MRVPLVEKYRPTTIDDYIFPSEDVRSFVERVISNKEIPNLLISGIQGTGKTTLVKILLSQCGIDDYDILQLRNRDDKRVEAIGERVESFVSLCPIGQYKVVVIEEADTLTRQAQEALRVPMEEYYQNARFILTCNYPNKIIDPLKSRCQHIHVENLPKKDMAVRVKHILDNEAINYTKEAIKTHVIRYHPDMRKVINSVDQHIHDGQLLPYDPKKVSDSSDFVALWEKLWAQDTPTMSKCLDLLVEMSDNDAVESIKIVYENIERLDVELRDNAYLACAIALADVPQSAIQRINLSGMIVRIFNNV